MPKLILIKHAQPVLDAATAARNWPLSDKGREQAGQLGENLAGKFAISHLFASTEPKAQQTAAIAGEALGLRPVVDPRFCEIDRPPLPIVNADEHLAMNRRIFEQPTKAMIGAESADAALARFSAGVTAIAHLSGRGDVAVVCHGTVIALFVAKHNPSTDGLLLWQSLGCPGYVCLAESDYALLATAAKLS